MDAYSNLIVQMSENRVNDLLRETRQRAAVRLARVIARRLRPTTTPRPVVMPAAAESPDLRRTA